MEGIDTPALRGSIGKFNVDIITIMQDYKISRVKQCKDTLVCLACLFSLPFTHCPKFILVGVSICNCLM